MIRPIIAQEKVEMMRVLVPLAEGFEEIEAISVIDILRRAEIEVVTAGLKEGLAEGSHKVKVLPDTTLEKVDWHDFDGLVLPGGAPGFVNLGNDQRILDLAREMNQGRKVRRGHMCSSFGSDQSRGLAGPQGHSQPLRQGPGAGLRRLPGGPGGGG